MLFLFFRPSKKDDPEFLGNFTKMSAVNKFIKDDLEMLKKDYPKMRWTKKDYLVARELK